MRALGKFVLRSRAHAAGSAALCLIVGWGLPFFLPLLSYLSGMMVALVALRAGAREGLIVIAMAALITALGSEVGFASPLAGLVMVPSLWLPVWLCAAVLRHTRQQGWALLVAATMAAVFAGVVRMMTGDAADFWLQIMQQAQTNAQAQGLPTLMPVEELTPLAQWMNSVMALSVMLSVAMIVLAARWWQAALMYPGGFAREFRNLQLPRGPMLVWGVGALLWAWQQGTLGILATPPAGHVGLGADLLVLCVVLLAHQGLALMHYQAVGVQGGQILLVLLYLGLLVAGLWTGFALAGAGLTEVIFRWRRADDQTQLGQAP